MRILRFVFHFFTDIFDILTAFGALLLGSLLQGWSGLVWAMVSFSSALVLDAVLMKNVRRLLDGLVD
ncbi:hypothetical protein F4604DRAFT_1701253 [Suillus subluteus]|nr:hypothetical protein F4604DRAFT_1701253 [Suillus subluteus]